MEMAKKSIDKKSLSSACKLEVVDKVNRFSWAQQLPKDFFPMPLSIHFPDGSQCTAHVSLIDFEELKLKSNESQCGYGQNMTCKPTLISYREIRKDQGILCPSLLEDSELLMSTVKHHLEFPSKVASNMEIKLDKLVLYEIGSHYKRSSFRTINKEVLGKIIIQLPVEGGYDGGSLSVKYSKKQLTFNNSENSQSAYYITVIFDSCEHWMEPITRGASVCLVYHLLWKNPEENAPHDLPLLVTAINEVKEALGSWIPDDEVTETCNSGNGSSHHGYEPVMQDYHGDEKNRFVDIATAARDNVPTARKSLNRRIEVDDVRFFQLEEKSCEFLSFKKLKGRDRDLALLLQNCPFLECTLALVNRRAIAVKYRTREDDSLWYDYSEKRSDTKIKYEIIRWVDSADRQVHLELELDWKNQSVWDKKERQFDFYSLFDGNRYRSQQDKITYMNVEGSLAFQLILVIWPKHLTIPLYFQYGKQILFDRIENSYHLSDSKEDIIPKVRQDLMGFLVGLIETGSRRNSLCISLMTRILRFSTVLRAREEGLVALKSLTKSFGDRYYNHHDRHESKELCRTIADFECQVAGWKDCAHIISDMIRNTSRNKVGNLLILARCFLDVNCVDGAIAIVDHISTHFSLINEDGFGSDDSELITDYLNLILSLEECPSTACQERLTSFQSEFTTLDSRVKYDVILHLESCHELRRSTSSCETFFLRLCANVSNSSKPYGRDIYQDTVVEILQMFVRLGHREWIESFVDCVTKPPESYPESPDGSSPTYTPSSPTYSDASLNYPHVDDDPSVKYSLVIPAQKKLIQNIIKDEGLWKLATSSELGKCVFNRLMDCNYSNINPYDWLTTSQDPMKSRQNVKNGREFLSYFYLILKMEKTASLADTTHINVLKTKLEEMTTEQLIFLLKSVERKTGKETKHKENSVVLKKIFQVILSRQKKSCNLPQTDKTFELTGYFFRLAESDVTSMWLELICQQSVVASLGLGESGLALFEKLITLSEWNALKFSDRLTTLNTCATLTLTTMERILHKIAKNYFVNSAERLAEEVYQCVDMFFFVEYQRSYHHHQFNHHQKNISSRFEELFVKLPLDSIIEFLQQIYINQWIDQGIVKVPVSIFEWYRNVMNFWLTQDFLSGYTSTNDFVSLVDLVDILSWLDDEEAWKNFSNSICRSKSFDLIFVPFGEDLQKEDVDVLESAAESSLAMEAFMKILAHAESLANQLVEPPFTWQQPSATLPGHPEVESFLRSDVEKFVSVKFKSIVDARQFAAFVELNQSSNNYSVTTETSGGGKLSHCIIKKKRSYHNQVIESFTVRRKQLNNLLFLKWKLNELCEKSSGHVPTVQEVDLTSSVGKTKAPEVDSTIGDDTVKEPPNKRVKV